MESNNIYLAKVKEELTYDDEFLLSNSLTFGGDNKSIKQEYLCKEEIDLEWDEKDNDYVDCESEFNGTSHETIAKSETDNRDSQMPRSPPKKPNALPKIIKRCCPKCDNLTEATKSFLYRKKKCATCSTISLMFQCAKCDKRYTHYGSIRYHVSTKCDPEEYHQCASCPYKTPIRSQLVKHVKRVHENNRNRPYLKCKKCGKEFKYTFSLNRHKKKACGANFPKGFVQCDKCDKKFKDEGYLKAHKRICGQEVRLRCEHCEFESKHRQRLITHLRKRHSGEKVSRK